METAVNAGLDMIMIPNGPGKPNNYVEFIEDLKALVAEGKVTPARIDDAVTRILRIKFQMGLFENAYADPALTAQIGSPEHRAVARECVQQSLVLLKNSAHTLPLAKTVKHLVVVGKGADDLGMQCGGWSIAWQGAGQLTTGTTILQAIRQTVSPGTEITFSADGSDLKSGDAVVVVIGETPYAEMKGDRAHLDLAAADLALVEKAKSMGMPVTTILISGRPLILGSALDASDAHHGENRRQPPQHGEIADTDTSGERVMGRVVVEGGQVFEPGDRGDQWGKTVDQPAGDSSCRRTDGQS